jgi:hypothetical protein
MFRDGYKNVQVVTSDGKKLVSYAPPYPVMW